MLELKNLTKVFGSRSEGTVAVDNVNLKVNKGEFVVLIGPSGCGKTTTLKMINRLVEPTSGDILINGESTNEVNHVQLRREIGYVIQSIGLFPHLTIAANVEIVPKLKKWDKERRRARTYELLKMVGLDPEVYANRYPPELSGGEQQRIGVLRALAVEPDLILMDEPFGALDPITREQLQVEIKQLQRDLNKTIVFVTHDMDEALQLADTVVLMKDGQIVQQASPAEMIAHPANDFVREFIGEERLADKPDSTPVAKIMAANPLVVKLADDLPSVRRAMEAEQTNIAVVINKPGAVVGLVSKQAIQKALEEKNKKLLDLVADASPATIRRSTSVKDAAAVLANGSRILCVVDRHGRPVGLVNRRTLLNGLVDMWEESA